MRRRLTVPLLLAFAASVVVHPSSAVAAGPDGLQLFESKIRPVLVQSCYACHSTGKDAKVKGDLRLDTKAGLLRGGSTGKPAVVPGDPEKSLLVEAIRYHNDELLMPPKARLAAEVVQAFEAWVRMGAPDPRTDAPLAAAAGQVGDGGAASHYKPPAAGSAEAKAHWSFRPVVPTDPPVVRDTAWAKTDADRFVLAKLEEKHLTPAAPADRRTLIRRATFDLTGLPPTPAEVDAFAADPSSDAFTKVVDRLLASPAYGERWGRHWLDLARYADTAGESADYPVPQAYRYRDYVIAAFNADKPYDAFVREQVAGDLLPAADDAARREHIVATGFVATARRFSVRPEREVHLTIDDTLDVLGKSVLGLSLSCARCHDHKFDPVPASDYYALYGIFSSTRYPMPGCEEIKFQKDFVPLVSQDEAERVLGPYKAKVAAAEQEIRDAQKARRAATDQKEQDTLRARERAAEKAAERLAREAPDVETAYAVADADKTGDAPIQLRGEPYNKGPVAPRGFLTVLGGQKLPADYQGSGRLELARWLTDPANPLTARVMVNRIWQHHFGRGLVKSASDFGIRGTPPTHPEMLDYLAGRFVAGGWSVKAMHRQIMLSATYQQSAAGDAANTAIDPANDLWWRADRRRLDAEEIRDAMLAVGGRLDASPGGAQPFPPMAKWGFTQHAPFTAVYPSDKRSVYLMVQRIRRHPFLATFDGADPNATTGERLVSTTPLQALFMMNDPFVHEQAAALADRATAQAVAETMSRATIAGPGNSGPTGDVARHVAAAFRLALLRPPLPEEAAAAESYLREFRQKAEADGVAAGADAGKAALASLCRALLASNEFLFVE
ncbi:MAG: Planctomycete cytochrome [Phycisphaerales bacterium]|nr:Planctomycete cytochrome [Phycisphaerales bacterium]